MNGIYAMYFTGTAGYGHALFVMKDGLISGADAIGGMLDGTYVDIGDGSLEFSVTLRIPAGAALVTGVIAGNEPLTQHMTTKLPVDFSNGSSIGIQTPTGPVNAVFKWLRDIP